ncbi:MAG: SsrA-binding protein SmpB [Armatimonadota bacterium]|nr:SsrA-binding protein SmpB [Armatimonadota bacterium]MDR5676549.1 SsrA-binding protein SmpB [Armatimonadota bacterium]MDR5688436.1 SsrA-binding protein SmpB [Armatimonadota bacterium]MDR7387135.1 SsrA-binding protein SmpB [Armatimonadota bacterium]MDR7388953.1 SsrA-binding protein SmpB [Armatimonadota bacterium]
MPAEGERTVVANRRARHDYHLEETYEAGLQLLGSEVKSLRAGRASLQDAYAKVRGGEVWLVNMHIAPYEQAGPFNHDPLRPRKLLLHRAEIRRLVGKVKERGYTLVPLRVYFRRGLAKVELALARGKKQYDKRADIRKREAQRQIARALAGRRRPARA